MSHGVQSVSCTACATTSYGTITGPHCASPVRTASPDLEATLLSLSGSTLLRSSLQTTGLRVPNLTTGNQGKKINHSAAGLQQSVRQNSELC